MLTTNAAKVLRLEDYGLEEGKRADIVILDTDNVKDAIRLQPARLFVIKAGKIIAKNEVKRELLI
jgi:cytosine deaminase